ncbi:WxL protein peptidoglycan domain-containing protein [Micromonospora musae]|uniref:WxL protein peptidoglycan domain-containing protein n=1 Tax=Micromonospora musae TaxID=1894970 RepID=UPI0034384E81
MPAPLIPALVATLALAAPSSPSAPAASAPPPVITVGVVPSTAKGPNGRSAFTYKLNPGASLTDYVGIVNHSKRPVTLAVYASDAFTTSRGGYDLLPADRKPVDVGSWVRLPARTVTVPSTSRVDVPFTLTVPANATPGDHSGGIVASLTATTTTGQGNQVAVDHRVGSRIHLRVAGELAPALAVQDLVVRYDGSANPLRGGTVTATFNVRNTGNVRLSGQPSLQVAGAFGLGRRTVDGAALPEILPGGTVRTSIRLTEVPPLLRLTATAAVAPRPVDGQVLDPPPTTATARSSLWTPPWTQLLLLVVCGALGWGLFTVRRRRRRRLAAALEAARAQGRAEAAATGPAPAPARPDVAGARAAPAPPGPDHQDHAPTIDSTGKGNR